MIVAPISIAVGWMALNSGTGKRMAEALSGQNIERLLFWRIHLDVWLSNPLFGRGPGILDGGLIKEFFIAAQSGDRTEFPHAHNLFIQTLADLGVTGFVLGSGAIVGLFLTLRRSLHEKLQTLTTPNTNPEVELDRISKARLKGALSGFMLAVIANMAHGLTQNTFYDANVTVVYMGLLAVIMLSIMGSDSAHNSSVN